MNCRHCGSPLIHTFLDLGIAPPSNAYLSKEDLNKPEVFYPLKVKVCENCWLVQTEDYTNAQALFTPEYAYFSSVSSSWLAHARLFSTSIIQELMLDETSYVVEIASNDGYLLRNFVAAGIPCLGIEPTESTAEVAEQYGVPVMREFFGESVGRRLADSGKLADLIVGNNVYAHVPAINDFTLGLKAMLARSGVITLEFPHLMRLIENSQFDTIYHEHFSYLSLHTVSRVFAESGLRIWKVDELSTHGGSLRIYGCHSDDPRATDPSVKKVADQENRRGMQDLQTYVGFQSRADKIKNDLLHFLIEKRRENKTVAAYGAAAKGNTILNYAGVKPDLLPFVCDAAPAKQGKFLPGSHIPIYAPDILAAKAPDYVLVLPWNIADEVQRQNIELKHKGVQFFTAVPRLLLL